MSEETKTPLKVVKTSKQSIGQQRKELAQERKAVTEDRDILINQQAQHQDNINGAYAKINADIATYHDNNRKERMQYKINAYMAAANYGGSDIHADAQAIYDNVWLEPEPLVPVMPDVIEDTK